MIVNNVKDSISINRKNRLVKTNRQLILILLSLPFVFIILSFFVAVIVTAMGVMEKGSLRFYVGSLSYTSLLGAFFLMPSYSVAYVWYVLTSKRESTLINLKNKLWKFPVVMIAFLWCPSFLIQKTGKLQMFFLLLFIVLILMYPFMIFIRLILRRWSIA